MTPTAALAALVAAVKNLRVRLDRDGEDVPMLTRCEHISVGRPELLVALAQAQAVLATPQEQTTERLEQLNVALTEQLVAADEAVSRLVVDVPCRVCGAKPVVPPFPWCREHVFNQETQAQAVLAQPSTCASPQTDPMLDRQRFERAPCYRCGYNGPGYFQPDTHLCADLYHSIPTPTPDRTTWPTEEAIIAAWYGLTSAAVLDSATPWIDAQRRWARRVLALFPTPEALAERIVAALWEIGGKDTERLEWVAWRDRLLTSRGREAIVALILRAIQETPR